MANQKEIFRRIKSTRNIAKITKAMELVAAAKMRKAQAAARASRTYSVLSSELLRTLSAKSQQLTHPLINRIMPEDEDAPRNEGRPREKTLVVLITSDRGLAGAFNTNVINKALGLLKQEGMERFDLITVGKKAAGAAKRNKLNVIAAFAGKDKNLSIFDVKPIAEIAIGDYLAFKYEKVFVVYTDFISTLKQSPNIIQVLPFATEISGNGTEFIFEPSPGEVLEKFLYRAIEFTIYQAMVESAASEHSARMMAMRNANEAAGDLIEDLRLTYNQARQAGITKELSEISAAKLAMEG